VSRAQVLDAIRIINEDFGRFSSDTNLVTAAFRPIFSNPRIRFRLAGKDPQGNCTDGITRTVSDLTNNAGDNVKSLVRWPSQRYLNVWVVRTIESGAGAYAYIPGSVGPALDGIVCRADQFGSIGSSNGGNFAARTLTHEIGHWANLLHTWGRTNNPGIQTNCNDDDGVADTPNTIGVGNQGCNLNQNTCGSLDNVQNYMDYSSCARMFTEGQKMRMRAALASNIGNRRGLSTNANLILTGTDSETQAPCPPTVSISSVQSKTCEGGTINFRSTVSNTIVDTSLRYSWTFPGGTPSTSTAENPNVVYNQGGRFSAELRVTNSAGSSTASMNNAIEVSTPENGVPIVSNEDFENETLFNHPTDFEKSWSVDNYGANPTWERYDGASFSGFYSVYLRNSVITTSAKKNDLITPIYYLDRNDRSLRLSFKLAYAPKSNGNNDNMRIFYSITCGRTWLPAPIYFKTANNSARLLNTVPSGTFIPGLFLPEPSQWREEEVDITAIASVANRTSLQFRFEFESRGGNDVYIDDFKIVSPTELATGLAKDRTVNVFPNPATHSIDIQSGHGISKVTITDLSGKVMYSHESSVASSLKLQINLNEVKIPSGMYFVKVETSGGLATQKLQVIR
jgi:PKD repeat protein